MSKTCQDGLMAQFSTYALCSPNLWMIIGCTFMTLLTMILTFYLHFGFRRDTRWFQFAQWKLQQLAERLRFQEPNVTILEKIHRKVYEKNADDAPNFQDFFRNSKEKHSKETPAQGPDEVAAKVKKAKDEDAAKVLRDTNIPSVTPNQRTPSDGASEKNHSILRKWTDVTKDILAIDDEDKKYKVDVTQDENLGNL